MRYFGVFPHSAATASAMERPQSAGRVGAGANQWTFDRTNMSALRDDMPNMGTMQMTHGSGGGLLGAHHAASAMDFTVANRTTGSDSPLMGSVNLGSSRTLGRGAGVAAAPVAGARGGILGKLGRGRVLPGQLACRHAVTGGSVAPNQLPSLTSRVCGCRCGCVWLQAGLQGDPQRAPAGHRTTRTAQDRRRTAASVAAAADTGRGRGTGIPTAGGTTTMTATRTTLRRTMREGTRCCSSATGSYRTSKVCRVVRGDTGRWV